MYKFVFTYLVKQNNKNLNDFKNSLDLLHKKILSKISCKFKVLIFCEGEPSNKAIEIINNLLENNIEIVIKKYVYKHILVEIL